MSYSQKEADLERELTAARQQAVQAVREAAYEGIQFRQRIEQLTAANEELNIQASRQAERIAELTDICENAEAREELATNEAKQWMYNSAKHEERIAELEENLSISTVNLEAEQQAHLATQRVLVRAYLNYSSGRSFSSGMRRAELDAVNAASAAVAQADAQKGQS